MAIRVSNENFKIPSYKPQELHISPETTALLLFRHFLHQFELLSSPPKPSASKNHMLEEGSNRMGEIIVGCRHNTEYSLIRSIHHSVDDQELNV